jgi:hypothetical protein
MPTTTYNIDRIIERVPEKSREAIRDTLDEIQLIVYSQDCLQTQKVLSTGMPPFITTVANTYEYDCPSDCRRTACVFSVEVPMTKSRSRPIGPRREYYFRNRGYYQVPVNSRDATYENAAKLFFQDNPGDTTSVYYHLYYIKPTRITSEEIQLTLPEETHYLLRKAVCSLFTTEDYGESGFDDDVIEKVARKIRNSLNRGYQSNVGMTPIPEEYQDDTTGVYGFR